MKTVQYFSDEALERSKDLTPEQIIKFLDNFRKLHSAAKIKTKSKLISIKVGMLEKFCSRSVLSIVCFQLYLNFK